ncbi:MAG: hypothetical protein U0132_03820 [Gemmatimonadaceae bacterium]
MSSKAFVDSFGFHWQVLEIAPVELSEQPAAAPHQPHGGWLYFLSRGATRVLDDYPREWMDGDWSALESLCALATPLGGESLIQPISRLIDVEVAALRPVAGC